MNRKWTLNQLFCIPVLLLLVVGICGVANYFDKQERRSAQVAAVVNIDQVQDNLERAALVAAAKKFIIGEHTNPEFTRLNGSTTIVETDVSESGLTVKVSFKLERTGGDVYTAILERSNGTFSYYGTERLRSSSVRDKERP